RALALLPPALQSGLGGYEPALLAVLSDAADLRETIVAALGHCGGHASLARLEALRAELVIPGSLGKAIDDAVTAIRERLGDKPGALSVAEPAGELAVTEA